MYDSCHLFRRKETVACAVAFLFEFVQERVVVNYPTTKYLLSNFEADMGIVKVSQFRFGIGADKERIFFVIHDVFFLFYAIKLHKIHCYSKV